LRVSTNKLKQVDPESGKTIERVNREAIRGLEKSLDAVEERIAGPAVPFISTDSGEMYEITGTHIIKSPTLVVHI